MRETARPRSAPQQRPCCSPPKAGGVWPRRGKQDVSLQEGAFPERPFSPPAPPGARVRRGQHFTLCPLQPQVAFLTSLSDEPPGMQRLKDLLTVRNRNFNRGRVLRGCCSDGKALKGRHIQSVEYEIWQVRIQPGDQLGAIQPMRLVPCHEEGRMVIASARPPGLL